jgi:uncharacterized membrane protein YoaK (UPF0700 family)
MGLAFLLQTEYLLPLTVVTLLLAVGALGFRAGRRRGYVPFFVGLLAAAVVIVGKFTLASDWMTYAGIACLFAASLWNAWPKKATGTVLIGLGTEKQERDHRTTRKEI